MYEGILKPDKSHTNCLIQLVLCETILTECQDVTLSHLLSVNAAALLTIKNLAQI